METKDAATKFAALAQATRIDVMRLLASRGTTGMSAGELASELQQAPSTLSFHLSALDQAGLVHSTRQGRNVIYFTTETLFAQIRHRVVIKHTRDFIPGGVSSTGVKKHSAAERVSWTRSPGGACRRMAAAQCPSASHTSRRGSNKAFGADACVMVG